MRFTLLALGLAFSAASAVAAGAASTPPKGICLQATSVIGTGVIDERTILFRMRDGTVWKNTMRQSCPNLKFQQGFSEVVRSDEICGNRQIITVLGTKNPCQLGDFTRVGASGR